jgi:hypothetical protein
MREAGRSASSESIYKVVRKVSWLCSSKVTPCSSGLRRVRGSSVYFMSGVLGLFRALYLTGSIGAFDAF